MVPLAPPPLSLYVHLPWCVRKCPYCDFNSHELRGEMPFARYVDALLADLELDLPLVWGRPIHSVFFGGGTPSLFPATELGRFLDAASARLTFAPHLEITLETNPGTVEHGKFEEYRAIGINRLSFGIQSFDDGCLKRLGRIHNGCEAESAVALARKAGFDNFNLDLMYALPEQTLTMAEADMTRAIALEPAHISHYQLTLEPNTLFAARPPSHLPDEDLAFDMQEHCQALLAANGYMHYEVSAYAKPGRQCAHNLNYWRFGDYLGIGAGAHGKITLGHEQNILRRWRHKHPSAWMSAAGDMAAIGDEERIVPAQRPFEFMLNALRLVDGFALAYFEQRCGLPASAIESQLHEAIARGWLVIDGDHVRPSELGQRFTNDVIGLFVAAGDG